MNCPMCSKEVDKKYKPFCSRRCADIDLNKWLTGKYAVPSEDPDDDEEQVSQLEKALDEDDESGGKLH